MSNDAGEVTLLKLFTSFMKMGAVLIGGGYALLPLIDDEIVSRRKWATHEEMVNYYAIAQVLPGVIAVNTAMLVGNRLKGFAGIIVAAIGLTVVPFVLIAVYAVLYDNFRDVKEVEHVLSCVQPAVAGMILGMGVNMIRKNGRSVWAIGLALCVTGIALWWNPPIVLMILGGVVVGILWHCVSMRKRVAV